mmetsp:Transcript_89874/g.256992  ORF Transcript_89874/g.256992 Transcript_89874/m.256992 type:complete len:151 (+) Transcript_89874:171-623(+)
MSRTMGRSKLWAPLYLLLTVTAHLMNEFSVVGEIDEACDDEKQPEECESLAMVYDSWGIHVEDYCDTETDPDDVDFSYYVCDDDGHVVYLGIRLNTLQGSVPTQIGRLTHLNHIQLQHNSLATSTVPTELGMLSQMTYLMMTQNSLTNAL